MLKFKRISFDLETGRVLDDASSLECLGGGKGGGGGGTVYVPQPAPAVTPPAPPPAAVSEATFISSTGDLESEEALKVKEAKKKGAKSLQIPLTDNTTATSDAAKAVGTV